jgi:hypothetical protein
VRPAIASVLALAASGALAQEAGELALFDRVASFPVAANAPEGADPAEETSAEIVAASGDGMTLIYTNSPAGLVGMVDIADPASPQPLGSLPTEGEPTSVATLGQTAFVAVDSSESFTEPSGHLVALDLATRAETARCDLGGQPDSVAVAPDGSFLAVAIENQRDEEAGDGRVPQLPGGFVAVVPLADGAPDCAGIVRADVSGLAGIAPEDPEPEFVDINAQGEIVVTLQENNHVAVLDRAGAVLSHFPAGAVDLQGIDTEDDGRLVLAGKQLDRLREPDAVKWIDEDRFAVANEGDMDGGSRGFTVFAQDGAALFESGPALEMAAAMAGHYPDARSDAKGVEPESIGFAAFEGTPLLFVGAERASLVGVYDVADPAAPVLRQVLPSGIGPEGFALIPERGLLVTANETDLGGDDLARSHVMIYAAGSQAPAYPSITSEGAEDTIAWAALSGLAVDLATPTTLYAVSDSAFDLQPRIFTVDAGQAPARITAAMDVTRGGMPAQKLDLEGIVADGEGGFWLASEGRTDRLVPHALLRVDADGEIQEEVPFPPELLAQETRFGAEGLALVDGTIWVAIQLPWGDDPENATKLVAYTPETGEWGAVRYPLAPPTGDGWVGLSEIAVHGEHAYLIERDNHTGDLARTKLVTRVPLAELVPAPLGGDLPTVTREVVRDLLPDLTATGGFALEKVEGLAVGPDGTAWLVTDNDAVDDSSGETMFWSFAVE